MVLNTGYKLTEIGSMPQDWDVKSLFELAEIATGTTPSTNNRHNYGQDYLFVSPADLGKEKYITDTEKKLSKLGFSAARKYPVNSILFTCIGSTIGKSGISKVELSSNQQINAVFPNDKFSSDFLFYYLAFISPKIKLGASEQAVPMINKTEFGKTQIALPTKTEQIVISEALSDADALITRLEKLIIKKRNIKQGAMQKLLYPKKGWVVKKLGNVAELITKGTTPTSLGKNFQNSGINFIKIESITRTGEIISDKVAYIDESTHQLLKRSQLKCSDILFSIAGALGRVAKVQNKILPANTNQALAIVRLPNNSEIDLNYLFIYLTSVRIQKHILNVSVQGAQANLSLLNISQLLIEVPQSKDEQNLIATIISDMDEEIISLEAKLEKYRRIKLGMMQNLLTGKIRLV